MEALSQAVAAADALAVSAAQTTESSRRSASHAASIRIVSIGGRYLVFDVADVARLRRHHSLCGVLVGITPQAPNQTVFSGLPLELAADEVRWLVQGGVAHVVGRSSSGLGTAHLAALADPLARRAYTDSLLRQRRLVQTAADVAAAERQKRSAEARAAAGKGKKGDNKATAVADSSVPAAAATVPQTRRPVPLPRITPTTSAGLWAEAETAEGTEGADPPSYPLRALLAERGYYATPGLRFGGDLSIYPGDPFRYHAHFVASSYGWDEPIALLDLVGSGRLATGVKKGLLIGGGRQVASPQEEANALGKATDRSAVRAFTLEWAAI